MLRSANLQSEMDQAWKDFEQDPSQKQLLHVMELARQAGDTTEAEYKKKAQTHLPKLLPESLQSLDLPEKHHLWILEEDIADEDELMIALIQEKDHPLNKERKEVFNSKIKADIPKVGLPTLELLSQAEDHPRRVKLREELRILSALHTVGGGDLQSDWVKKLVQECPNVATLQKLPYEQKQGPCLRALLENSTAGQKQAIMDLYVEGDPLRKQLLENRLDFCMEPTLKQKQVDDISKMAPNTMKEVLAAMPPGSRTAQHALRRAHNELSPEWRQELAKKKKEETEQRSKLQKAQNELHEAEHALAAARQKAATDDASNALEKAKKAAEEKIQKVMTALKVSDWKGSVDDVDKLMPMIQGAVAGSLASCNEWSTPEEIANRASGGLARHAVRLSPDKPVLQNEQPTHPLLADFPCVEWVGPPPGEQSTVINYCSEHTAHFEKQVECQGWQTAVSANFEGFGAKAAYTYARAHEEHNESLNQNKGTTSCGSKVTYVYSPQGAFRIPRDALMLSSEAKEAAKTITDSVEKAKKFLTIRGDHVFAGLHVVGGIWISNQTASSKRKITTVEMMKAFSDSQSHGASAGFSGFGVSGGASLEHSEVEAKGEAEGDHTEKVQIEKRTKVTMFGPNIQCPDLFKQKLSSSPGTWHLIDRQGGQIEDYIPVWELLEKEGMPEQAQMLKLAWMQTRVGYMALGDLAKVSKFSDDDAGSDQPLM